MDDMVVIPSFRSQGKNGITLNHAVRLVKCRNPFIQVTR